jgi:NAD(P)-dependent dehydrogenase (short-subunit alcohol dehydrogenase family)
MGVMKQHRNYDPAMERGAIFVTGASTGIGRATAERLAKAGYDVIPGLRRPDTLPEPIKASVSLDLADPASLGPACADVLDRANGRLVGVVNNAGYTVSGPCEALEVEDWRQQFEVNFFGHLAITRALLPALLENRGRVVNVGSIGGRFSAPFIAPYSASKFAVRAWSDALRLELAPHGVRVALIEPGAIATPLWGKGNAVADENLERLTPEQQQRYARQIEGARKAAQMAEKHAIPADKCAQVIEHALTAKRPKGRYLVGVDARLQAAVSILPTRTYDRVSRLLLSQPRASR